MVRQDRIFLCNEFLQVCSKRSLPARPSKKSLTVMYRVWGGFSNLWKNLAKEHLCSLGTPIIFDPTAFRHASQHRAHLAAFRGTPKSGANALNCTSHLLLNGWVDGGLTNIA